MVQNELTSGESENRAAESRKLSPWLQARLPKRILPSARPAPVRNRFRDSKVQKSDSIGQRSGRLSSQITGQWRLATRSTSGIPESGTINFLNRKVTVNSSIWRKLDFLWVGNNSVRRPGTPMPDENSRTTFYRRPEKKDDSTQSVTDLLSTLSSEDTIKKSDIHGHKGLPPKEELKSNAKPSPRKARTGTPKHLIQEMTDPDYPVVSNQKGTMAVRDTEIDRKSEVLPLDTSVTSHFTPGIEPNNNGAQSASIPISFKVDRTITPVSDKTDNYKEAEDRKVESRVKETPQRSAQTLTPKANNVSPHPLSKENYSLTHDDKIPRVQEAPVDIPNNIDKSVTKSIVKDMSVDDSSVPVVHSKSETRIATEHSKVRAKHLSKSSHRSLVFKRNSSSSKIFNRTGKPNLSITTDNIGQSKSNVLTLKSDSLIEAGPGQDFKEQTAINEPDIMNSPESGSKTVTAKEKIEYVHLLGEEIPKGQEILRTDLKNVDKTTVKPLTNSRNIKLAPVPLVSSISEIRMTKDPGNIPLTHFEQGFNKVPSLYRNTSPDAIDDQIGNGISSNTSGKVAKIRPQISANRSQSISRSFSNSDRGRRSNTIKQTATDDPSRRGVPGKAFQATTKNALDINPHLEPSHQSGYKVDNSLVDSTGMSNNFKPEIIPADDESPTKPEVEEITQPAGNIYSLENIGNLNSQVLTKTDKNISLKPVSQPAPLNGTVSKPSPLANSLFRSSKPDLPPVFKDESGSQPEPVYPVSKKGGTVQAKYLNQNDLAEDIAGRSSKMVSKIQTKQGKPDKSVIKGYQLPSNNVVRPQQITEATDNRTPDVPIQRSPKSFRPLIRYNNNEDSGLMPHSDFGISQRNILSDPSDLDMPLARSGQPRTDSRAESKDGVFRGFSSITPTSQSSSRLISPEGSDRKVTSTNETLDTSIVQRTPEEESEDKSGKEEKLDLKALARELYPLIKRMVIIDKERLPR